MAVSIFLLNGDTVHPAYFLAAPMCAFLAGWLPFRIVGKVIATFFFPKLQD